MLEENSYLTVLKRDESSSAWVTLVPRGLLRKVGTLFAFVSEPTGKDTRNFADTGEWFAINSPRIKTISLN